MSLLTDALRLREGRGPSQGNYGPSFPPFRGPSPARWILAVALVCCLSVVVWWKGEWVVVLLEESVGIPPEGKKSQLFATAPRDQAEGKTSKEEIPMAPVIVEKSQVASSTSDRPLARGALAETRPPEKNMEKELVENPNMPVSKKEDVVSVRPVAVPSPKPKEAATGEEPIPGAGSKVSQQAANPAARESGKSAVGEVPRTGTVPGGGLQPMKVELAEMELVLESPEEREKKRVDGVEAFLRALQVQGVRLQGGESRILVDGSAIALGEKVGSLGLILEKVEPQKIIFSDAAGKKYPKSY